MVQKSNNLERFWKELKRRKVIRITTVYAAAAFIILQLTDIIAQPLQLPSWTLPFVIVLLCIGFIIAVLLTWIYDITPEGVQMTKPVDDVKSNEKVKPIASNGWKIATYASGVIIVALITFNFINNRNLNTDASKLEKSIAVLPFRNDSPVDSNKYFANGMMEDILNHLVKINDLNVKSRSDTEPYRETTKSLKEIGKELGVANILEGSVRKQGNRFKISIQLILAESGFNLWSDTFDGEYSEGIFKIQSNIAQKVATALNAVITRNEKVKIEQVPTTNIKAYEFYIRAQQLLDSYWRDHDTKYMPEAQRLLDKALEIDPGYEMAIAAKGGVFLAQSKYDSVLIYANRLKDLNPYSPNGYFMKGEYYNFFNVPDSAIENYLHSIKFFNKNEISDKEWSEFQIGWVYCIQKNDYQRGFQYLQKGWDVKEKDDWVRPYMVGNIFLSIGDYEKSNKYYQMSLGIDESPLCISSYSMSLMVQLRSEEALSFLDTICKEPQSKPFCNQGRFYIHLILKEFDLAEQFYTNFLYSGGTPDVRDSIWLSYMYKKTGKGQAAMTLLKRCKISQEDQKVKNVDFYLNLYLASIYALMDNKEAVLKNLTKSVDIGLRWGWHDFLEICPFFENLWDDSDFKAIVLRAQNEKATIRTQIRKMEQSGEIDL